MKILCFILVNHRTSIYYWSIPIKIITVMNYFIYSISFSRNTFSSLLCNFFFLSRFRTPSFVLLPSPSLWLPLFSFYRHSSRVMLLFGVWNCSSWLKFSIVVGETLVVVCRHHVYLPWLSTFLWSRVYAGIIILWPMGLFSVYKIGFLKLLHYYFNLYYSFTLSIFWSLLQSDWFP